MHTTKNCHTERSRSATHRILALLLTVTILLPSITPYNTISANNRGPNAPEAASFEPVDATDMVNLLTGDFSYVLPLMNVPSPEGGYPIALAYHGGIAMDLESSWVGLGWNLNPGAINRTINGYPDDYSNSPLTDYFYDSGGENVSYYAGVGYSYGGASVGVGYAWGSNQSSSGYVSVGYGVKGFGADVKIGINQESSTGVGFQFAGGLSLGASLSTDGTASGTVGFNNNGVGYSVSASTEGTYQTSIKQRANGFSTGINLSSEGASLLVNYKHKNHGGSGSVGIGAHTAFNTTIKQSDYTTRQSGYNYGIIIPTSFGVFSFSWGKRKVVYYSAKETNTTLTGPLKFGFQKNSEKYYQVDCEIKPVFIGASKSTEEEELNALEQSKGTVKSTQLLTSFSKYFDNITEAEEFKIWQESAQGCTNGRCYDCEEVKRVVTSEAFMDTYEIPLDETKELSDAFDITHNNPVFPAYDKYNVQAQGLSGSIHATLIDNGRLFGLSKETKEVDVNYEFDGLYDEVGELNDDLAFREHPEFYFDNEITSYLLTPKAVFTNINSAINKSSIKDVFNGLEGEESTTNRFKKGNYIEYATNIELLTNSYNTREFLEVSTDFDRSTLPFRGIGAYKITAVDGKTYHYSLPVYNHETITRTYGLVEKRTKECESYLEKRQLEAYATHWLLTAVTGADFVDNGDGVAGEGDLGYWVNFDYGLWSNAYVWSPHPDEPYIEDVENETIKTWIKGRKQLYYLDKIQTRTHTAVFIKSEDESNPSLEWEYASVDHDGSREQGCNNDENIDYKSRFTIPSHSRLKLDRILLIKNENFNLKKDRYNTSKSVDVYFNDSKKTIQYAGYNHNQNVYDIADNWEVLKPSIIKEVVLDQDYRLSNKQLTLNEVDFKGKQGASVLPPYQFEYIEDDQYSYNLDDANDWGYYKEAPELWSLDTIITPQGGEIIVDYEPHNFRSVQTHQYTIKDTSFIFEDGRFEIEIVDDFNIYEGRIVDLDVSFVNNITVESHSIIDSFISFFYSMDTVNYKGKATIVKIETSDNGKTILQLIPNISNDFQIVERRSNSLRDVSMEVFTGLGIVKIANSVNGSYSTLTINTKENGNTYLAQGGIRVKGITTTDGFYKSTSDYSYGENEDGFGWVTYVPYAPNAQKEVPYSAELPPSRPMYEYVTLRSKDSDENFIGTTQYQYNVLKDKTLSENKYGDFYELASDRDETESIEDVKTVFIDEYTIKDNLSSIGQLLSVSTYNKENQLLSKLSNQYYTPEELPDNMGVVQESYQSYKKNVYKNSSLHSYEEGEVHWMVNSSTRIKYPSILKSSTELKNGVSYITNFSDFDLTLGQAKETQSVSSLGLEMKTVSEPAFYHYPEMGSKADDVNNKNMLSQGAQTLSYFKEKSSTDWELYSAEVDTWKKWEDNVWRKHQNYVWKSALKANGSYQNFSAFNYDSDTQAADWQRLSEITKYSSYSKALETMYINGNKASNKLSDNHSKVMAVCNAPYDEMYNANFEYAEDFEDVNNSGGVLLSSGVINSNKAHTGENSFKVTTGDALVTKVKVREAYKASVWVHKNNYEHTFMSLVISGTNQTKVFNYNPNEIIEAGDWVQLNFKFSTFSTDTTDISLYTTSGTAYYDDFRMYPISSAMTSYVYNEWDELTHVLGANNMAVKYEYDASGKLIRTYKEVAKNSSTDGGFKLINETNYNYKNQ